MLKKYSIFMLVLVMMLVTACSNGGKTTKTEGETQGKAASTESKDGGELKVALAASPKTLDPISYTAVYEGNVIKSIADTLVNYSKDLSTIEPNLATDWKISDDLKTYTFNLRDDVYFQKGKYQDGRQMKAEDVKYSLERSAKESAMNRLRMVKSVEVLGDFKVAIHLSEPNAAVLAVLTDSGNVIVPKEEVEGWGDQFGLHLVGTGPFKLDEWKIDEHIKESRHEKYWGEKPHLDKLTWKVISDQNMMVNALRSGDIDVATDIQGQNRAVLEKDSSFNFLSVPGLSIEYVALNMMKGPTKDLKVRQAINMATDAEAIVKGAFKYGGAVRSYLPLPQSSWGYDKSLEAEVPKYDPKKAKELLAEAGYPDGFKTELYVIQKRVPQATIFQSQMKENLNIDVKLNVVEMGILSDVASKGKAPMYLMGWSWYPDPDFFLYQMFHSKQIGSLGNGYGYNNPEVDRLLTKATSETVDQGERAKIYQDILKLIIKDAPRVEATLVEVTAGTSKKVNGFKVSPDSSVNIVNKNTNVWLGK